MLPTSLKQCGVLKPEEVVSSSMAEAVKGEAKLTTDEEFKGSFRTGTVHSSSVTLNNDYHQQQSSLLRPFHSFPFVRESKFSPATF